MKKHNLVISHERSGTHFLINTLSNNFAIKPGRIDLDYHNGDFTVAQNILKLVHTATKQLTEPHTIKAHQSIDFFPPELLDEIAKHVNIFYIYRDGRDVMTSFWHFLNKITWFEGPKTKTVGELMRHQPSGRLMRYQLQQYAHMLERWKQHVTGWLSTNKDYIFFISYEKLMQHFETVVEEDIAKFLEQPCATNITCPSKHEHVIHPWRGKIGTWEEFFTPEDIDFFEENAGEFNRQLNEKQ